MPNICFKIDGQNFLNGDVMYRGPQIFYLPRAPQNLAPALGRMPPKNDFFNHNQIEFERSGNL